ncbi:MAG: hypothetical protein K9K65_19075 [Desulfarculaceae bacterium]|nr:hypothetical protein [Desulfarculaceae bacterium]MCF8099946.1 hypothetical protein [Desulfarculaceae bacterium]
MKPALILCLALTFMLAGVAPLLAASTRPAKWYNPQHRMAGPGNSCPRGYSRLFGRNPPTCFRNCQRGYGVISSHISGASCVRCPRGYSPVKNQAGGFYCTAPNNDGRRVIPDSGRSTGGVFGQ